jgi:hypothetical protein
LKKILFSFFLLFLFSCSGYRPSATYVEKVVGQNIYATVDTIVEEPQNSFLLEDALKEALKTRLNVSFENRLNSDSQIKISLRDLKFRPLQYNENGYIILYRTEIVLEARHTYMRLIDEEEKEISQIYTLKGFYEFPVKPNVSISMAIKFDAIKFAALKAIDVLIPKLAQQGAKI